LETLVEIISQGAEVNWFECLSQDMTKKLALSLVTK
jgi:hypothetical protein